MNGKFVTFKQQDEIMQQAETENLSAAIIGTFWIDVWEGGFGLVGEVLDRHSFEKRKYVYGDMWHVDYFRGKLATVLVITDMRYITKEQALWFATKFVKGEYRTIHVDLKELTSFTVAGKPVNPRQ